MDRSEKKRRHQHAQTYRVASMDDLLESGLVEFVHRGQAAQAAVDAQLEKYLDIDQSDLRPENWDAATQSCRRHGERRCRICLGHRQPVGTSTTPEKPAVACPGCGGETHRAVDGNRSWIEFTHGCGFTTEVR